MIRPRLDEGDRPGRDLRPGRKGARMAAVIRPTDLCDVQCDNCKVLHPVRSKVGNTLETMDILNTSRRPCPACGAPAQWVLLKEVPSSAALD